MINQTPINKYSHKRFLHFVFGVLRKSFNARSKTQLNSCFRIYLKNRKKSVYRLKICLHSLFLQICLENPQIKKFLFILTKNLFVSSN